MTFGPKYYLVDQIKDDRMRGACGKRGREQKCTLRFLLENLKEREHFGRPKHRGEDANIMGLKRNGMEWKDWVHMAQDRDKQWDLVNVVMSHQVL
jgi:hypothetical protein